MLIVWGALPPSRPKQRSDKATAGYVHILLTQGPSWEFKLNTIVKMYPLSDPRVIISHQHFPGFPDLLDGTIDAKY